MLLCLVLFLPGFFSLPPVDRDESRFAQASRQMLETQDFVDIRFQNEGRHKKPAGIYWLQSASAAVFGADRIWAYRLPSLVGAIAAVLLTLALGNRLFAPPVGFAAAALLACSLLLNIEARQAKTDAMLLAAIMAAQYGLARLYLQRGKTKTGGAPFWALWLGIGAGILLKGPIVLLVTGLTALTICVSERRWRWLLASRPLAGLAVVLVLVLPWGIAFWWSQGDAMLREGLVNDMFNKVASGQEGHGAPPGYNLALLTLTFWPGSLLALAAAPAIWSRRGEPAVRFCLAWLVPCWLVFEAVPTKLPHYVLPLFPAIALLTAAALGAATRRSILARVGRVWWLLVTVPLAIVPPVLIYLLDGRIDAVAVAGGIAVAGLATIAWRGVRPLLSLGAAAAVLYLVAFQWTIPRLGPIWLSERMAKAVASIDTTRPIVSIAGYSEPSAVFRLGTATRFESGAAAAAALLGGKSALAIVAVNEEGDFRRRLGQAGRAVVTLDTFGGLNYSNGRRLMFSLYRLAPT